MPIGACSIRRGSSIASPACGYSLGTTFSPNWMDWPMLFSGNPVLAEPGMVFFLHCVVADSGRGVAMSLGRTCPGGWFGK